MTSGEYAYDLLRQLQKRFRCTDAGVRAYLYNFFGELFTHPSVTVTEEAHDAFIEQMEEDAEYYAQKGLTDLSDIYQDENFETSFTLLKDSFATIDITMEMQPKDDLTGYPNGIDFTLPDGTLKSIASDPFDYAYLCSRTGAEYGYAKRMMPYYTFEYEDVKDLSELNTNIAGYGTTWTFDESTGDFEVSGEGAFAGGNLLTYLGIKNAVTTLIFGAGVNRLMTGSLALSKDLIIVSFRGAEDPMIFDNGFVGTYTLGEGKSPCYTYTIYTDNKDLISAPFSVNENITVIFKALSEWEG